MTYEGVQHERQSKADSKTKRAVGKNVSTACCRCHTAQKDKDYVFSAYCK